MLLRDGGFPYCLFYRDWGVYDITMPLGRGISGFVRVQSAVAVDATHVKVIFSHEMKHSDPEAEDDTLNPNNYTFGVSGGVNITAKSVSLEQAAPTIVIVTTSEMTNNADYSVEVSNVRTIDDELIDTVLDTANFTGIGERPNLSSAAAVDIATISVTFSEKMDSVYLGSKDSYSISPAHFSIDSVDTISNPVIYLAIDGEMLTGQDYTLTVSSGMRDIAWNPIQNRVTHFLGLGKAPRLLQAEFITPNKVRIVFDEPMNTGTLSIKTNYYITGPEDIEITDVINVGSDYATIVFTEPSESGTYIIHCTSNIKDLIGNSIDPNYNAKSFEVVKPSYPHIETIPSSGTIGVDPRSYVILHFYDDPEEFSGINQASIEVGFIIDGITFVAVSAGVIDTNNFVGEISGDPLAAEGIVYKLRPKTDWPPTRFISGRAAAADIAGWETVTTFSFVTARSNCLEDHTIEPQPIEDLMLSTPLPGVFKQLQEQFLLYSNTSGKPYTNTRTCLFYASQGKTLTLISDIIGTDFIDVPLCDRLPILEMYRRIKPLLDKLLREIKNSELIAPEQRMVFLKYLQSPSPVEVVAAAAALFIYLVNRVNNV